MNTHHRTQVGAPTTCAATLILLATALLAPDMAMAAGEQIGQNLGDLLRGWATSIFGGVVAIVSIVFLINRRYNELVLFVGAALLVGGFVFAPGSVTNAIRGIWEVVAS